MEGPILSFQKVGEISLVLIMLFIESKYGSDNSRSVFNVQFQDIAEVTAYIWKKDLPSLGLKMYDFVCVAYKFSQE